MNFKTTYILFGVLAVLVGIFAVVLWYDPTARNSTEKYVLPALHEATAPVKVDDIDYVEIDRREPTQEEKIVLERDKETGRWNMVEPRHLRADKSVVTGLIQQIVEAMREQNVDKAPSLAVWGLQPPKEVITLKKGDRTFKLDIGDSTAGKEGLLYVLDPMRPKDPMAVKKSRLDAVLKNVNDFRDTELLASAASDLQSLSLAEGKNTITWKKDDRGHWMYTEPKGYGEAESGPDDTTPAPAGQVKTPGSISTVLTDVTNLRVEKPADFVADDVSDFAPYNLDPSKAGILEIAVTQLQEIGKDENGKIKTKPVERTLLIGLSKKTDEKGDQYYACLKGEKSVVKVSAKNVEPLTKLLVDKGALRDRFLVRLDEQPSVVAVKNTYGDFELMRTHNSKPEMPIAGMPPSPDRWTLWRSDKSQNVDPMLMQGPTSLVSLLRQKNIDSFIDLKESKDAQAQQERELDLDKPATVVELWNDQDGVVPDDAADKDKADDKRTKPHLKTPKEPTYRLSFGKVVNERDKELVAVKREVKRKDGQYDVTLVRVPKPVLDKAKEGPLAYLDKTLSHFTEQGMMPWPGVTKLVIQRGGQTIELAREKDEQPWKIVKPTELAGRDAEPSKVENVLATLNRLIAVRLVTEKAKDDVELDRDYGLKTPQAKVEITVTKDGKPVTSTYDFGKDAPDGTQYAKQGQRDLIFTVNKNVLMGLPNAGIDVLDPVVFKLDNPDKVTKVTLTGWQNLIGSPVTLEIEHKDKKWELKKGPPNFNLDGSKVQKLLDDLRVCRAERFVVFKTGPKPDMELDVAKGALLIELTVEGEAKPITLTIGKLDGDKGYFAMSNRREGDVFVLPKSLFEGPKSRPAYFSPQ
jgi:Domain of unknown function (DUF4340)